LGFCWIYYKKRFCGRMLSDGYKVVLDQVAAKIAKEVETKAPEMDKGKLKEMDKIVLD
jgi:ribosomal protein S19E (S16A)